MVQILDMAEMFFSEGRDTSTRARHQEQLGTQAFAVFVTCQK
jgi:hypothetical protein